MKSAIVLGAAVLTLSLINGCVSSEYTTGSHSQDIYFYSSEKEVAMGVNIAEQVAKEYTISQNPLDKQRLNLIGQKIADVCDRQEINYYFYLIEKDGKNNKEDEKNAFSLPGGYVYIFKGLFDMLDDDELAFVLAHEVGHTVSRHVIKKLQAGMGYNFLIIASLPGARDAGFTRDLSYALSQVMASYSREDELNADELAVKYCRAAGYRPEAGIEVMEKIYRESKKKPRPFSYLRTHPYTDQRIRRIKETLHLPLDVGDYINQ